VYLGNRSKVVGKGLIHSQMAENDPLKTSSSDPNIELGALLLILAILGDITTMHQHLHVICKL
jgi:hypothetical protein